MQHRTAGVSGWSCLMHRPVEIDFTTVTGSLYLYVVLTSSCATSDISTFFICLHMSSFQSNVTKLQSKCECGVFTSSLFSPWSLSRLGCNDVLLPLFTVRLMYALKLCLCWAASNDIGQQLVSPKWKVFRKKQKREDEEKLFKFSSWWPAVHLKNLAVCRKS